MKHRIHTFAYGIVTLALLGTGVAVAAPDRIERSEKVVEARGLTAVEVANDRGETIVRPSADGRIHVTAIKTSRADDPAAIDRIARETSVDLAASGPTYRIEVRYPKRIDVQVDFWKLFSRHGHDGPMVPQVEVKLIIETPAALAATCRAVSGDLSTEGLSGAQTLHTTSGDISVRGARGAVTASTVSGDVRCVDGVRADVHTTSGDVHVEGAGALSIETTSGDVEVLGARESVRMHSSSGDLEADAAPGGLDAESTSGTVRVQHAARQVHASTASGEVDLGLAAPIGGVDASTVSGSVHCALPAGSGGMLELQTVSGDLSCDAPIRILDQSRNRLSARIGGGGPVLRLKTTSGDIHVTSGGQ